MKINCSRLTPFVSATSAMPCFLIAFCHPNGSWIRTLANCLGLMVLTLPLASSFGDAPDFGRAVRPILAKHCFACHGPDEETREAGLRLDTEAGAMVDLGGYRAVDPDDVEASELLLRVTSDDDDLRMPPADSHPPLSDDEVAILRDWVRAGGRYTQHWAFEPPRPVEIPRINPESDAAWCRNPIDAFVLARLQQAGLRPAPEADKESLLRRLSLDLTGLTPTPQEVQQFLTDDHEAAYERLVDRLLASPAYAERFARLWLDLARYSDTNGYEKDRPRTIWPYRDWVIRAIAADVPFDQFSIEQLAGDMLPGATAQQRIATGFHRNTMMNEEGGIDPLEYRFYAMIDRVATTGTVWLGLTTGCAQCHTHKYDPITHTDFYAFYDLLNQADEPELDVVEPASELRRRETESKMVAEENRLAAELLPPLAETGMPPDEDGTWGEIAAEFLRQVQHALEQARHWSVIRPTTMHSTMPILRQQPDGSILATGDVTKRDIYRLHFKIDEVQSPITAVRLEVLPHPLLPAGGPGMAFYEGRRGDFFLSELTATFNQSSVMFQDASHSYGSISVGSGSADASNVIDGEGSTGWSTSGAEGKANRLILNFAQPITEPGELVIEMQFERHFAAALGRFRFSLTSHPETTLANAFPAEVDQTIQETYLTSQVLDANTYAEMQRHFVATSPLLAPHRQSLERMRRSLEEPVRTLVFTQRASDDYRPTHRHHRGEYLNAEEVVAPAIPAALGELDPDVPADRLALARWLVSDSNPLVGRVTVNRAWRAFFGTGIVRTAGDYGTQSEPPTHPELLDYLAVDLRQHGWSMKRLHRQIVLSSTYRQAVTAVHESDPDQRLLAGFPHRRLDAELVRDALLSAAGLMTFQLGGPSVYPPQGVGVTELAYGATAWKVSQGGDRFRRSLYTFSKRTAPFAAYAAFDAPSGELCVARRDRSTTPLQALTLLNDPMYMEIARGLAATVQRDLPAGSEPTQIATTIFQRLFVRQPSADELAAILDFYHRQQEHAEPWTLVARALMNTDEAITTP